MTTRIKVDSLHGLTQKLISCKQDIGKNIFNIGGILFLIKHQGLWEGQHESYNAFIASPELSFSRSWAEKARKIFEVFEDKLKITKKVIDIDSDKLYYISAFADKENFNEWIEKARQLSRSDLRFELSKEKGTHTADPAKNITDTIKEFLYEYLPKKKIEPDSLELEELLTKYEKFKRA